MLEPFGLPKIMRLRDNARLLQVVLVLLLLVDLAYSFFQHYHSMLDGDMADIVLPAPRYAHVLKDPFGLRALIGGEYYGGSNRFVPHWTMSAFYKTVPHALQALATPLDSVYLASAVALTSIQAVLIYLISACAVGTRRLINTRLLVAALIVTPLFQTYGFNWHVGIISGSPTYSFFYPLASAWMLFFFLPFFLFYLHGQTIAASWFAVVLAIPLAWAVSFNGPLNPAVMLLICPPVLLYEGWMWWKRRQHGEPGRCSLVGAPRWILYACAAGVVWAALSYAVGRHNIENLEQTIPLRDRYMKLPKGIRDFFFNTPAVLILADVLLLNLALISLLRLSAVRRTHRLTFGFVVFAVVFTLLLPLGGYRPYRPFIIRADSIQPVILGAIILYAFTTVQLLRHFKLQARALYSLIPVAVCIYFTYWDEPNRGNNYCEREALKAIAASPQRVALTGAACTIMAWEKIADPKRSANNARLLHYWRILPEEKLYYQP